MEIKDLSRSAILENLAEECAELAHAALKEARRLRGENPTPATAEECRTALAEEAADVTNMIGLAIEMGSIDKTEVACLMAEKMARFVKRLKEA